MRVLISLLVLALNFFLSACLCNCDCEFCSGCKNFTATNSLSKKVVARASFCTEGNEFTNDAFLDSCSNFQKRFSDSLIVASVDSAQNCIKRVDLSCKETENYKEYHCMCYK